MKYVGLFLVLVWGYGSSLYSKEILKSIYTGPDTMIHLPEANAKTVKVRLGLTVIPMSKLIVKDAQGINQVRFGKNKALRRNLRARLTASSNFFLEDWHIEIQPIQWKKVSKNLTYKVSVYQRFGTSKNVEEKLGSFNLAGVIQGQDYLYEFRGETSQTFKNKTGDKVVEVQLGAPIKFQKRINIATIKKKNSE